MISKPLTQHSTSGFKKLTKRKPYKLKPFELLASKQQGALPTLKSMYSDDMIQCVKRAYRQDIALYKRALGPENLLVA